MFAYTVQSAAEVESEEDAAPKSKSKKATSSKAAPAKAPDSKPVDDGRSHADALLDLASNILTDPLASDPHCVKVKDWRHKLQRAFLGKELPKEEVSLSYRFDLPDHGRRTSRLRFGCAT